MSSYPVTLGLEEEFFALEAGRDRPTLQSMDYLRRFAWSSPSRHMTHSASNFAKGEDRRECFMGSIELSTGKHSYVPSLTADLIERRTAFAKAARTALIVPTGTLYQLKSPTNTASSHIHVGVPSEERLRVYGNLAYFTPVFATAAANSPYEGGSRFGLSSRMAGEGLLGSLREDCEYRFQDLILSKRLGTIEMRIFDPIPEIERLATIMTAIQAVAAWPGTIPLDRDDYNRVRPAWTKEGLNSEVERRLQELQEIVTFPRELLESNLSDKMAQVAEKQSIEAAYAELDRIWREPTGVRADPKAFSVLKAAAGLTLFYGLRLPFVAYKGWLEWYGKGARR